MRLIPWLPVPLAVLALTVWRPGLLLDGTQSLAGLAVMVGVGLSGLLVLAVFWRRSRQLAVSLASVVVLALMAATLWPAFRERTVVEAFPAVVDAASSAQLAPAPAPAPPTTPATPVARPSTGVSVAPSPRATPPPRDTAPAPSAAPTSPAVSAVRLSGGRFSGIHHQASGRAALYDVSGRTVLRFTDISFQGTPGPSVHLVHRGARTPNGGVALGALKGEHGSFTYRTPAGFAAAAGWSVLVWCDTYDVPIAAADLI